MYRKTCLRVAIDEALLRCNLVVRFSSIIQKTGAMCEKTGIFKSLHVQLKLGFLNGGEGTKHHSRSYKIKRPNKVIFWGGNTLSACTLP